MKPPLTQTDPVNSGLDIKLIESALSTYVIGKVDNCLYDEIDSTNTCASAMASAGAPEGTLVLARRQTAGRGRLGRQWVSPPDAGVYMSLIVRPQMERNDLPLLSLMTGVACAQAVQRLTNVEVQLKWVNDLVFKGRKLGGILVEMVAGQTNAACLPALVIGIGLNINLAGVEIPDEIKAKVDWLENLTSSPVDRNVLVAEICNCIEAQYLELRNGGGALIIERWSQRSCTLGKMVRAEGAGNRAISGLASGIGPTGALIVQQEDGTEIMLYGGEVSVRLEDGRYA